MEHFEQRSESLGPMVFGLVNRSETGLYAVGRLCVVRLELRDGSTIHCVKRASAIPDHDEPALESSGNNWS
jgi:hypothetical protein